jgi:hypothetical protein
MRGSLFAIRSSLLTARRIVVYKNGTAGLAAKRKKLNLVC